MSGRTKSKSKHQSKKHRGSPQENGTSSDTELDIDHYIVEEIRAKKGKKDKARYLVKWEGYPEDQCTWEPARNLTAVSYMIDEYEKHGRNKDSGDAGSERSKRVSKPKHPKKSQIRMAPNALSKHEVKKNKSKSVDRKHEKKSHRSHRRVEPETEESEDSSSEDSNRDILEIDPAHLKKSDSKHHAKRIINEPPSVKKIKLNTSGASINKPQFTDGLPLQGHFMYGDKAKRIVNAKFESNNDVNYILCFVEWEPRSNGTQPIPTPFTNIDLKTQDPVLLCNFYETRLKVSNPKNNPEDRGLFPPRPSSLLHANGTASDRIQEEKEFSSPNHRGMEEGAGTRDEDSVAAVMKKAAGAAHQDRATQRLANNVTRDHTEHQTGEDKDDKLLLDLAEEAKHDGNRQDSAIKPPAKVNSTPSRTSAKDTSSKPTQSSDRKILSTVFNELKTASHQPEHKNAVKQILSRLNDQMQKEADTESN